MQLLFPAHLTTGRGHHPIKHITYHELLLGLITVGLSVSKRQKLHGRHGSQLYRSPSPKSSQEGGAVYTTIDEPNFLQPYRDPESVKDNANFPLDGQVFESVSDEKLVALFNTAPRLHHYSSNKIVRISKSLVLKGGPDVVTSEARNMVFAAESLGLPVPKMHRSFTASVPQSYSTDMVDGHFIVMDYIAGPTVEESWQSLGKDARESTARQVADMIKKMQSCRLNYMPPGPLGSSNEKCQGPWFTDYGAGPFATRQVLQDWFNHKVDVCIQVLQLPANATRFQFRDFVFTHQDIAERNLIIGAAGKVWLVDWGCAGVYPVGFKQVAFREQSTISSFVEMVLSKLSDRQDEMARKKAAIAYGLSTGRHL